jgi:hypothetical protein
LPIKAASAVSVSSTCVCHVSQEIRNCSLGRAGTSGSVKKWNLPRNPTVPGTGTRSASVLAGLPPGPQTQASYKRRDTSPQL